MNESDIIINKVRELIGTTDVSNEKRERIELLLLSHEKHTARFVRRLVDELFPPKTKLEREREARAKGKVGYVKPVGDRIDMPTLCTAHVYLLTTGMSDTVLKACEIATSIVIQVRTSAGTFCDTIGKFEDVALIKVLHCAVKLPTMAVFTEAVEVESVVLSFKVGVVSYALTFVPMPSVNSPYNYFNLREESIY